MAERYAVQATYYEGALGYAEFPEDKTWADVEDFYIKWDCLWVKFKGAEVYEEFGLNSQGDSDWKRPISWQILGVDEDESPDYDEVLAESGEEN